MGGGVKGMTSGYKMSQSETRWAAWCLSRVTLQRYPGVAERAGLGGEVACNGGGAVCADSAVNHEMV